MSAELWRELNSGVGQMDEIGSVLRSRVEEYEELYFDYLRSLRGKGIEIGELYARFEENASHRERLAELGAKFRNGGASVSSGWLSDACVACTGGEGSRTFYYSLRCHRNCYYCFNPNQSGYDEHTATDRNWRAEFERIAESGRRMTHVALTGGEPLLRPSETLAFFEEAHRLWPDAHLRLYTSGDQLDARIAEDLARRGLSEIRFSVKLDDGADVYAAALDRIRLARRYGYDVMVEMPVVPGTFEEMRALLDSLDKMGCSGVNLLEFCYPFHNWGEYARRGFKVKNPPFEVLYDYEYAGSLPIEGSEEEALALMVDNIERGRSLGVHYCSLANKHRDQIYQQNHSVRFDDPVYLLDSEDFFLKTCKAYGEDAVSARRILETLPLGPQECDLWRCDDDDGSVLFHPKLLDYLELGDVRTVMSINVIERRGDDTLLRELDLVPQWKAVPAE